MKKNKPFNTIKEYQEHQKELRDATEHVWMTKYQANPDAYSEVDTQVEDFAYSEGFHNGPECIKCGYSYCMHCNDPETKCKGEK